MPVYSKLVLPSRKSLEIIINIKIKIKLKIIEKLEKKKNWGCSLIRACSLIRSNTVYRETIGHNNSTARSPVAVVEHDLLDE